MTILGDNIGAGVGEDDVFVALGVAVGPEIGHEDARAAGERHRGTLGLLGGPIDGDDGTVHVDLAVADIVVPNPGEQGVLVGRGIGRQGEVELGVSVDGAAADVALDDGETLTAVDGDGSLAASTAMQGTTRGNGEVVRATRRPGRHGTASRRSQKAMVALARELGGTSKIIRHAVVHIPGGDGERVELALERRRVAHLLVSEDRAGHGQQAGEREERRELHGRCEM